LPKTHRHRNDESKSTCCWFFPSIVDLDGVFLVRRFYVHLPGFQELGEDPHEYIVLSVADECSFDSDKPEMADLGHGIILRLSGLSADISN